MTHRSFHSSTQAGLTRAFQRWAASIPFRAVSVPGANEVERGRLAALGGVARAITGYVDPNWPEPVRLWASDAPEPPQAITDQTVHYLEAGTDSLGLLYNASISAANRRRLGTVFTPPVLVEHMFRLVEQELQGSEPSLMLDPGAGVGAFTLAAAQKWPSALVVASDINVVTLGLLAARLAFDARLHPEHARSYRRVELRLGDYLDQLASSFSADLPGTAVVLGNPPYTRAQALPPEDRVKAAGMAGELIDSGHANLAMLFQAATLNSMRPPDVSCMVIPGSFSYTRASRALRRSLWESHRSVVVHRTPATTTVFVGRAVQPAVLLVGRERHKPEPVRLARIALSTNGVDVIEEMALDRASPEPGNWFWNATPPPTSMANSVALGDLATIRRGTATGANKMFFVTDAIKATLPPIVIRRGMLKLRDFEDDELTTEAHATFGTDKTQRWILAIPQDLPLTGALLEYVDRHLWVSERYLPSIRPNWWALTELPRPQILLGPLSKHRFRVVLNTAAAIPSNNLFGITRTDGGDPRPLATWLRSDAGQDELRRLSRRYPGGSHKLELIRMREVRIPRDLG